MLQVKNLHASIEGKEILKGVNLTVKPGEVRVVLPDGTTRVGPARSGLLTVAREGVTLLGDFSWD